jgi:hypothetical protein
MKKFIGIKLKLIGLIVVSSLVLGACSNPFDSLANQLNGLFSEGESSSVSNSDNGEDSAEAHENALFDYSSLQGVGEQTSLTEGEYVVGKDVPEGRYSVTSNGGRGNFAVTSEAEKRLNSINGILSDEAGDDNATDEIITYLFEGHTITIYSEEGVTFTPYDEQVSIDHVPTGQYIVGEDFDPGVYEVHSEETESYYSLDVYNSDFQERKARLQLGSPEYGGAESHVTQFDEGDIIVVSAPLVELIPQD